MKILIKDMASRSHLRDTIPVLVGTGVSQVCVAVLYLLAARQVGPSAFGFALILISVGNFCVTFMDFGQNSYLLRELAAGNLMKQQVARQIQQKGVAAACVSVIIGMAVYFLSGKILLAGTVTLYIILLSLELTAQSVLRWTGGARRFSLSVVGDKAVSLLFYVGTLVANFNSDLMFPISLTVGSFAGILIAIRLHPGTVPVIWHKFSLKHALGYAKMSQGFGWYGFIVALQGLDTLALGFVAGSEATGTYAAVSRWIMPLVLISTAYSQASYPHFAAATAHAAAKQMFMNGRKLWLWSATVIMIVLICAPTLVEVLLGGEYGGSTLVLRILGVSVLFMIVNQPLAVLLQTRGLQGKVSVSVGLGIFLQLISTLILGRYLGAVGGACAWVLGQIVIFSLLSSVYRKLQ